jgi:hypothetical protein
MEALQNHLREHTLTELRSQILSFMRTTDPSVPEEEVARRLNATLSTANNYGIVTERHLIRLTHMLVVFPWDADMSRENAWLWRTLGAPMSAEQRLDTLEATLRKSRTA